VVQNGENQMASNMDWMFHDFPLQFPEVFQLARSSMGTGIIVQQQDTF
jgi:hypothetical protein